MPSLDDSYEEAPCDRCGNMWDVNDMRQIGDKKICSACDAELETDDTAKFDRWDREQEMAMGGRLTDTSFVDAQTEARQPRGGTGGPVRVSIKISSRLRGRDKLEDMWGIKLEKNPSEPDRFFVSGLYNVVEDFLHAYVQMPESQIKKLMSTAQELDNVQTESIHSNTNVCDKCGYEIGPDEQLHYAGDNYYVCGSCLSQLDDEEMNSRPNEEQTMQTESTETNEFDKFMDDIVVKEQAQKKIEIEDTPQRRFMKSRRERPLNRIRIGIKQ